MNQKTNKIRTISAIKTVSDKVSIISARCNNCNKHFESMRSITMHLKMAGRGHAVTFINYGNYDETTGLLRESKRLRRGNTQLSDLAAWDSS